MKFYITIFFVFFLSFCNSQEKRKHIGDSEFQRKMNADFKDASRSPLKKRDLKNFKGLSFFPIDNKFKVTANLKKLNDSTVYKFNTTTSRIVEYHKYGILTFVIDNKKHSLNLFKSVNSYGNKAKYSNSLFLPFYDKTNGKTSYKGGRFIELKTFNISKDKTIVIDFNQAYNPYCAYNSKYSCPIVPSQNRLNIKIEAGVMAYKIE